MLLALLLALTVDPASADPPTEFADVTPAIAAETATVETPQRGPLVLPVVAAPSEQPAPALRFVWREHPQLRWGRNFRVDFGAKLQEDLRHAGDDPDPAQFPTWQLHRARVGADGEIFRKIQFSIEHEFSESILNDPTKKSTKSQWKDVYLEYNVSNAIQLRGGKFKIPYGLDETSGETNLDFTYRSLGGDYLSPGRDIGGMVHGRFFKRGLNYWAAVTKQDGDNSRSSNPDPNLRKIRGADTTVSGRVTGSPFRKVGGFLEDAEVGGSVATSSLSDKGFTPNGLRGRTVLTQVYFFEPMFVKGTRRRYGADVDIPHGPFDVRAEYMLDVDTRDQQGFGDENLSNVRGKAWYVHGTWIVTGEKKQRPIEPRKGGLGLGGFGALEIGVRYDTLRFDSEIGHDTPFANPRAETILPNEDDVVTLGFNYRANRWVKIQGNAIHESILDLDRSPTPSGKFWSTVLRLQLEL